MARSLSLTAFGAALLILFCARSEAKKCGPDEIQVGGLCLDRSVLPAANRCPPDSVQVGSVCADKYEASVWLIPLTNPALIAAVKNGSISSPADLANATPPQFENGVDCALDGSNCLDVYAVSVAGVQPASFITWFQAAAACANSGKRLLTNQEWQVAALGTPNPGEFNNGSTDCNTSRKFFSIVDTGSRVRCISERGAHDMVGNVREWVADWVPLQGPGHEHCGPWDDPLDYGYDFSHDPTCFGGDSGTGLPGALLRGGGFFDGPDAGVYSVITFIPPSGRAGNGGFRCGRELR